MSHPDLSKNLSNRLPDFEHTPPPPLPKEELEGFKEYLNENDLKAVRVWPARKKMFVHFVPEKLDYFGGRIKFFGYCPAHYSEGVAVIFRRTTPAEMSARIAKSNSKFLHGVTVYDKPHVEIEFKGGMTINRYFDTMYEAKKYADRQIGDRPWLREY